MNARESSTATGSVVVETAGSAVPNCALVVRSVDTVTCFTGDELLGAPGAPAAGSMYPATVLMCSRRLTSVSANSARFNSHLEKGHNNP